VVLRGAAGMRALPIGQFISGPGSTNRTPDELLTQVQFLRLPARSATVFLKAGRRRAMEISMVCVAAALTLDADRATCKAVRLAVGAAAPTAFRAASAEQFLIGKTITDETLAEVGRLVAEAAAPIDDVRASADYRRLLVARMSVRAVAQCAERIGKAAR
jgi:aerobic carbon-monoxide dehydrogenase medium subunit